ncbi:hypothetical protein [Methylobacterium sp. JK268]
MIPVEILVMTFGAVGAIVIVVAARPGRPPLRWPRNPVLPDAAGPQARAAIRSGNALPPR